MGHLILTDQRNKNRLVKGFILKAINIHFQNRTCSTTDGNKNCAPTLIQRLQILMKFFFFIPNTDQVPLSFKHIKQLISSLPLFTDTGDTGASPNSLVVYSTYYTGRSVYGRSLCEYFSFCFQCGNQSNYRNQIKIFTKWPLLKIASCQNSLFIASKCTKYLRRHKDIYQKTVLQNKKEGGGCLKRKC